MKKIKLLCIAIFILSAASYSQFSKGSLLLGVDLNFGIGKSTNGATVTKSNGIGFSPVVAIATRQNTFWGGALSAGYSKSETVSPSSIQKNNNYGASVFCRRYKPVFGKLYAFVQGGITAGISNYKINNGPDSYSEIKNFNAGLNITPGLSANVAKNVYLETGFSNIASINYSHSKSSSYNFGNTTTGKTDNFGFSSSLGIFSNNIYLGFRFIIPKNS
jgi:hypothetical protein